MAMSHSIQIVMGYYPYVLLIVYVKLKFDLKILKIHPLPPLLATPSREIAYIQEHNQDACKFICFRGRKVASGSS